jgi:Phage tail assembly chaperone proteins, E, or 41 or 14
VNEQPRMKEGFVEEAEPVATPAPAPVSPLDLEQWPINVKLLHKSIRDNKGNQIKELSFREPTGGDINRYGNPVRIDQNGDVLIDEKKMTSIMASLSGILQPFIEQMDPRDWNSCAYRLRSFFLPDPAAW